jgi:hypothetical protein
MERGRCREWQGMAGNGREGYGGGGEAKEVREGREGRERAVREERAEEGVRLLRDDMPDSRGLRDGGGEGEGDDHALLEMMERE